MAAKKSPAKSKVGAKKSPAQKKALISVVLSFRNEANVLPFYAMMMFLGVLFFAIVYAWKKGVLEWQK